MLSALSKDLLAENRELDSLLSRVSEEQWDLKTPFFEWTIRDEILHLHQVDLFGLSSLGMGEDFEHVVKHVRARQKAGVELSEQARRDFSEDDSEQLLLRWRAGYEQLVRCCLDADPMNRLRWFGPDMSLMSFISARQMEVWAHGQDIYDCLGITRETKSRVRNICELGVRTFGWSFKNRGLDIPTAPRVVLHSPQDETWDWEGVGGGLVEGPARDFALVVTQRRAFEDTQLVATGRNAHTWMQIAQCFAGRPQERAAPGKHASC